MKNKFLLVLAIAILAFFAFAEFSPSAQNISKDTSEMKFALENEYDCIIDSSHYRQILWNQKLVFRIAKDSKSVPTEDEAREYLAANFPSFKYIDVFEVD